MNELLTKVLEAHGGQDRWRGYNKVEATIVSGGGLFALKGILPDTNPRRMTARSISCPTVVGCIQRANKLREVFRRHGPGRRWRSRKEPTSAGVWTSCRMRSPTVDASGFWRWLTTSPANA